MPGYLSNFANRCDRVLTLSLQQTDRVADTSNVAGHHYYSGIRVHLVAKTIFAGGYLVRRKKASQFRLMIAKFVGQSREVGFFREMLARLSVQQRGDFRYSVGYLIGCHYSAFLLTEPQLHHSRRSSLF